MLSKIYVMIYSVLKTLGCILKDSWKNIFGRKMLLLRILFYKYVKIRMRNTFVVTAILQIFSGILNFNNLFRLPGTTFENLIIVDLFRDLHTFYIEKPSILNRQHTTTARALIF